MNKLNSTKSMEMKKVKSIQEKISKYTYRNTDDLINITEWQNEEGWTISIGERVFDLCYGELEAIQYLIKVMEHDFIE